MENKNNVRKGTKLAKILYVLSAVLAVIFVYVLIVNIMYIRSYTVSYGMAISDMWQETIQYVVTGSVSYFVYAVLLFAAGKIISMMSDGRCCAPQIPAEELCCAESSEEGQDAEAEADDVKTEGFDPDQVINRLNKNEAAEEQPDAEPDEPEITVVPIRQRKKRRYIK